MNRYCKQPFPSEAYWAFQQYTESSKLVISEFFESWILETYGNHDLTQSYSESDDHVLLTAGYGSTYAFRKTRYLKQRRCAIDKASELLIKDGLESQAREAEQQYEDAIRRSSFEIFTYLMEDTRNGLIKIGKSKNPERREKTLQSEASTVELRIAVPTESDFEFELHNVFANFRRRGEWFALSSLEIKDVIERLLKNGDPSRAVTSHEWLGSIFLSAHTSYKKQNENGEIS